MQNMDATTREFMESSTIHGLAEIVRSKRRFEQVVFVFAFLTCIAFSVYGCYQIISQYIEKPVATTYFVQEADDLLLPDLTICPFNRLNQNYVRRHNISERLAKYIQWSFVPTAPRYKFASYDVIRNPGNNYSEYFKLEAEIDVLLNATNQTFEELLDSASLACRDLVSQCVTAVQRLDCCADSQDIMTNFGKCFRLHGIQQNTSGFGGGMTALIELPIDNYTIAENSALNDGVLIKLTESGKGYEFDAIFLPPNVHALVQIRATKLDFMPNVPQYTCMDDADPSYAPLLCTYQCLFRPVQDTCKCRYIGAPPDESTKKLKVCRPIDMLSCTYNAIGDYYKTHPTFSKECKRRCKPRCMYWQYHPTVSHADYPSILAKRHYASHFGSEKSKRKKEIIAEIFYEKLEYTLIQHFPSVTTDQFLADIVLEITPDQITLSRR